MQAQAFADNACSMVKGSPCARKRGPPVGATAGPALPPRPKASSAPAREGAQPAKAAAAVGSVKSPARAASVAAVATKAGVSHLLDTCRLLPCAWRLHGQVCARWAARPSVKQDERWQGQTYHWLPSCSLRLLSECRKCGCIRPCPQQISCLCKAMHSYTWRQFLGDRSKSVLDIHVQNPLQKSSPKQRPNHHLQHLQQRKAVLSPPRSGKLLPKSRKPTGLPQPRRTQPRRSLLSRLR